MGENDDRRRAAAKCIHCGAIGIVHVWSDGTCKPVGQSAFCECDDPQLRELEDDLDADDELL
ncbi:hypothetical protein RBH26_15880 [Natronolimnohabitans sp. A-GB9]|uniref:hypothetical protein n=1 Tax=Natronolimnohabitans sp. A-GB9 TaxID=3069757 RepID=UPI0027B4CA24|nr:hypothetical protein [Natronolimnohabitans sp. A-GB9]MDQ2051958.1 hypothetical protein [Natronolimnohabitans sp. A-GB9]